MILVLIFQILLTISLGGMVFLLAHKIPALANIESASVPSPQNKEALKKTKDFFKGGTKLLRPALKEAKHRVLRAVRPKQEEPEGKVEQIEQNRDYWDKLSE